MIYCYQNFIGKNLITAYYEISYFGFNFHRKSTYSSHGGRAKTVEKYTIVCKTKIDNKMNKCRKNSYTMQNATILQHFWPNFS